MENQYSICKILKMKKKLSPEQEELLNKFKNTEKTGQHNTANKNQKAQNNATKPTIRRSGSRGK